MVDLSKTIEPKSDQLNSDSIVSGPITILTTKVTAGDAEQPIAIHYEGGEGKPYKPAKSMRRVLGQVWGWDGNAYAGRKLTLYRDPEVKFGGDKVGGIRISHMSHIDKRHTLMLTTTRGKKAAYSVDPIPTEAKSAPPAPKPAQAAPTGAEVSLDDREKAFRQRITDAGTGIKLKALWAASAQLRTDIHEADPQRAIALEKFWQDRFDAVEPPTE